MQAIVTTFWTRRKSTQLKNGNNFPTMYCVCACLYVCACVCMFMCVCVSVVVGVAVVYLNREKQRMLMNQKAPERLDVRIRRHLQRMQRHQPRILRHRQRQHRQRLRRNRPRSVSLGKCNSHIAFVASRFYVHSHKHTYTTTHTNKVRKKPPHCCQ